MFLCLKAKNLARSGLEELLGAFEWDGGSCQPRWPADLACSTDRLLALGCSSQECGCDGWATHVYLYLTYSTISGQPMRLRHGLCSHKQKVEHGEDAVGENGAAWTGSGERQVSGKYSIQSRTEN
jgi:hypothetical protein